MWGVYSEANGKEAEKLQINFLRSILKVSQTTCTAIVLAEFGRLPLSYTWWKQVLRYHDRMVKLASDPKNQDRLLVHAFKSSVMLSDSKHVDTWCGKLRNWLQTKSTVYRISQKLDHKQLLEHEKGLQLRLIGDGSTTVTRLYRSIKVGYEPEAYLRAVKSFKLRTVLSRFRCGQHGLEVQLGRQASVYVPREDRKCRVCHQQCVEDEHHFLFLCPLYADIRQKYAELFWDLADGSVRVFLNYNDLNLVAHFIEECLMSRRQHMNNIDQ